MRKKSTKRFHRMPKATALTEVRAEVRAVTCMHGGDGKPPVACPRGGMCAETLRQPWVGGKDVA